MALILIPCACCGHPQMASEDVFWLKLEIQCEECFKYFGPNEKQPPLFISRIYNPPTITN